MTAISAVLFAAALGLSLTCAGAETHLRAADFGAVGDGVADDGPAIARAVAALRKTAPPATLEFGKGKTYRVRTASETWIFTLDGLRDLTIDGGGSEFVLDPKHRLLHLTNCARTTVRDLTVDFDPLPFVDGTVVAVDAASHSIDVRIADGFPMPPLGGPTGVREQAYFGMLWNPGPHGLLGTHYFIADMREAFAGSLPQRIVRVVAAPDFGGFAAIKPNETRISLPVRGIAHRMEGHGASPVFVIEDNDTARFERIGLWSAPLFAVNVARNRGSLTFSHFDIRPKPGTSRLTSSWRDGFHVKANRAKLLWEDCWLEGMNDDSFNTATHSSTVTQVLSQRSIRIRQVFPLGFVPFEPGDEIGGYSVAQGRLLGPVRVAAVMAETKVDASDPDKPAPALRIELAADLPGIAAGDIVWNRTSANPDTTIRRCTIRNSCRYQSPVALDGCDIAALCWFYGDNIEGPLPRDARILHCKLLLGRGNPDIVVAFASNITGPDGKPAPPREPVLHDILMEDNEIDGRLQIEHADGIRLTGNRFVGARSALAIGASRGIELERNTLRGEKLRTPDQIAVPDEATKREIQFR